MLAPFRTEPSFHARPWGGRAMAERLGKKIPDGPVGESWEVSAHPHGISKAADGPLAGMSLAEIAAAARAPSCSARGRHAAYGGEFPVLVKLIDVNSLASVQVHPDDGQALRLEGYPRGKTEAWYIVVSALPRRGSTSVSWRASRLRPSAAPCRSEKRASFSQRPRSLQETACSSRPGTVHACGEGVLLLEVQQSCDITYRVYDWDRVDEKGARRELHVEKALQVIDWAARPAVLHPERKPDALNPILSCVTFDIDEARVRAGIDLPALPLCRTGTVVEGRCTLAGAGTRLPLACGDSFVAPAGAGFRLEAGPAAVVVTTIR